MAATWVLEAHAERRASSSLALSTNKINYEFQITNYEIK